MSPQILSAKFFKKIILVLSALLINSLARANDEEHHSGWDVDSHTDPSAATAVSSDHHAFVHPFLVHMGMPDDPGELSIRVMSVEERNTGVAAGTYGFHVETGIVDRLGLHLRNDGVKTHSKTEMMLQYAVLRSDDKLSGLSFVAEIEVPTGSTASNRIENMFGVSFAYLWAPVLAVNSTVHYNSDDKKAEWEISLVGRLTEKIYPVLEFSGENTQEMSLASALFAWKFKIPGGNSLGVGYRIPITTNREFDSQLILQAEFNFH